MKVKLRKSNVILIIISLCVLLIGIVGTIIYTKVKDSTNAYVAEGVDYDSSAYVEDVSETQTSTVNNSQTQTVQENVAEEVEVQEEQPVQVLAQDDTPDGVVAAPAAPVVQAVADGDGTDADAEQQYEEVITQTYEQIGLNKLGYEQNTWEPVATVANYETPNFDLILPYVNAEKSSDKTNVVEGDEITYTISVGNYADKDTKNVQVVDFIPEGTIYVESLTEGVNLYYDEESNVTIVEWIFDLTPNSVKEVSFKVKVTDISKDIKNTAIVNNKETNEVTVKVVKNISVRKQWDDRSNQDLTRKPLKMNLYGNNEKVATHTLEVGEDVQDFEFENLPIYDEQGKEITYRVEEENLEGYESYYALEAGVHVFTNYHKPEMFNGDGTLNVAKEWDDDEVNRPESIVVDLYKKVSDYGIDYKMKSVTLSEENDWTYTFTKLEKNLGGKPVQYYIQESPVEGYETTIDQVTDDLGKVGYVITNSKTYMPNIEIAKNVVQVNDLALPVGMTSNVGGVHESDKVIYQITAKNTGNAVLNVKNITDTRDIKLIGIATTTPLEREDLRVQLSSKLDSVVSADENLMGLEDFPLYPEEYLTFTVEYTVTYEDTYDNKTITNLGKVNASFKDEEIVKEDSAAFETEFISHTTNVLVNKVWKDANYESKRPSQIVVNLLRDGTKIDSATIATTVNTHPFENLPTENVNGHKYAYTVEEITVPGYLSTIENSEVAANTYTITNTYQKVPKITVIQNRYESIQEAIPLDVTFVLDVSGSMQEVTENDGTKRYEKMIDATNEALEKLLQNENNRVGIVTFAGDSSTLLPLGSYEYEDIELTAVSSWRTDYIKCGNNSIQISGGTNTHSGFRQASDLMNAVSTNKEGRIPVVIVITDGVPTKYYAWPEDMTETENQTISGTGYHSSFDATYAYNTILSGHYYKNKISGYTSPVEMYSFAIDIPTDPSNYEAMAKVALHDSQENIEALDATDEMHQELITLLNSDSNPYKGEDSYTKGLYYGSVADLQDQLLSLVNDKVGYLGTTTKVFTKDEILEDRVYLRSLGSNDVIIKINGTIVIETLQDALDQGYLIPEGDIYLVNLEKYEETDVVILTYDLVD